MNKKDIIESMKKQYLDEESLDKLEDISEKYQDKSKDDVFFEIIQLNTNLKNTMSDEEYELLFEKLENIRPLLTDEQNEKLDSVLNLINKNEES